jgi:hypothetical protein
MLTINNNISVVRDTKQNILFSTQNGQLVPKEAVNMTMYITTDTQEIFFGNELKQFILYSGMNDMTAAEVETLVKTLVKFDVDDLRFQLTVLSDQNKTLLGYTIYDTNTGLTPVQYVPSLRQELTGYTDPVNPNTQSQASKDGLIRTQIVSYLTSETDIIEDINTAVSSTILSDYYNKEAIDEFIDTATQNASEVEYNRTVLTSEHRLTAVNVQTAIDELKLLADDKVGLQYASDNFVSQSEFETVSDKVDLFATIEDAGTFTSAETLRQAILGILTYNETTFDHNGIYRIRVGNQNRYEILMVNNIEEASWDNRHFTRLTYDGKTFKLLIDTVTIGNSAWVEVNPAGVASVNEVEPDPSNGDIFLDANSIPETSARKWNNLLPQTVADQYSNAINPSGRASADLVGDNSVSFGVNSAATAESSVAIGNTAKATATNAVQLGTGTNGTTDSLKFMDKHVVVGSSIPGEIKLFSTAVIDIPLSGWNTSDKTYVATVTGMTSDAIVWVGPHEDTFANYIESEVRAFQQGTNTLTFKCTDLPTNGTGNVKINVTWRVISGYSAIS